MSNTEIEYNFYYWGPLLIKVKVSPEDLNKIRLLCKKDTRKKANKLLAGIIEDEYKIDIKKYDKIMQPYLEAFYDGYQRHYGKELKQQLKTKLAWVNYMKSGESNPVHTHDNCDFSSVLYLQVPEEIKQEPYEGRSGGPGAISFIHGTPTEHSIYLLNFKPEEGEFFIFPHNLMHTVNPFKANVERISVAANFVLS